MKPGAEAPGERHLGLGADRAHRPAMKPGAEAPGEGHTMPTEATRAWIPQ